MKRKPIFVLSAVVVAAAVIIPPVFIKPTVQQHFSAWQEQVNQTPGYALSIEPEEDGWFRSHYTAKLSYDISLIDPELAELTDSEDGLVTVPLQITTAYGPLFFAGPFGIGAAQATVQVDGENLPDFIQWDKDTPFYQLEIVRGFGGGFTHKDQLAAFEASRSGDNETLIFDGYKGHGTYSSGVLEHDASIDRIELKGDSPVLIENYTVNSIFHAPLEDLFNGSSYSYSMDAEIERIKLADLVSIQDIQASAHNTLDDSKELNDTTMTMTTDVMELTDFGKVEDIKLTMALNHISTEFLRRYNDAVMNGLMTNDSTMQQSQLVEFLKNNLALFLEAKPEFNVTEFTAHYDGNAFAFGAHSHIEAGETPDVKALVLGPEAWLPLIKADASLTIDQPLLEAIVSPFIATQLEPMLSQGHITQEEFDSMLSDAQQQMIGGLIAQGLLEEREDAYVSNFLMDKGEMTLNGQSMNL